MMTQPISLIGKVVHCILILAASNFESTLQYKHGLYNQSTVTLGGNFTLGGIFSIRHRVTTMNGSGSCEIIDVSGLIRMTAMMYAVDVINADLNILPGVKLGYVIVDDCGEPSQAISATIDFLIGPYWNNSRLWVSTKDQQLLRKKTDLLEQSAIIAMIGASNSDTSAAIAGFLNIASVPQVSFGAIGESLSNKVRYPTFMRTIPSAKLQITAIIDLIKYFDWSWVSIVASDDEYGKLTTYTFNSKLTDLNICTATTHYLSSSIEPTEVENIFNIITSNFSNVGMAYVVILALDDHTTHAFFQKSQALGYDDALGSKLWIVTKAWGDSTISPSFDCLPQGVLGLIPKVPRAKNFESFLESLTVDGLEKMNKWFTEYFDSLTNRELRDRRFGFDEFAMHVMDQLAKLHNLTSQGKNNTIKITPDWLVALSSVPQVISAVYCVALSLDHLERTNTLNKTTERHLLEQLHNLDFSQYAKHLNLKGVEFLPNFNLGGDVPVGYWISNLQQIGQTRKFVRVLSWDIAATNGSRLHPVANSSIQWPTAHGEQYGPDVVPCSQCGQQCQPGTFKLLSSVHCCWTCASCKKGTYSNFTNAHNCSLCPEKMISNKEKTDCYFATDYASWSDPMDITVLVLDGLGLTATFLVITFFLRFQHTPIFVCSNRFLTIILIVCQTSVFALPPLYIARPSPFVCITQVLVYSTSFSAICGIFLVKTWHVNRIFKLTGSSVSSNFNTTRRQAHRREILLTVGFSLFPLVMLVPIILVKRIEPSVHIAFCGTTWIILQYTASCYIILLSAAATYMAFKARDLPENYNEAKYICSTVLCFLLFWTASLLSYYQIDDVINRTFVLSICVQGAGFSVIIFMFCPKLLIALMHPEQNTTAYVRRMNMLHTWRKQLSGHSSEGAGRQNSNELQQDEGLRDMGVKGCLKNRETSHTSIKKTVIFT